MARIGDTAQSVKFLSPELKDRVGSRAPKSSLGVMSQLCEGRQTDPQGPLLMICLNRERNYLHNLGDLCLTPGSPVKAKREN